MNWKTLNEVKADPIVILSQTEEVAAWLTSPE